jgi:hypothetical protein
MSNQVLSIYKDFSDHAKTTLSLENGFDSLIQECFNESNAKKFKTNFYLAIATAINTQGDTITECLKNAVLRAKVCNSIVNIIQLGAVIDYRYIYFTKFGGKNPNAGFDIQYQAEVSVLEQNGYTDIQTGFVLKDEKFLVKTTMDRIEILHEPNYKDRLIEAKNIMDDVVCGYAIYTQRGIRTAFVVDKDILQASYEMSNERSEKAGKANLKWRFKKAIDISVIHALYNYLVLKNWDSEEFDYQNKLTEGQKEVKSPDDIFEDYNPQINSQQVQVNNTPKDAGLQQEPNQELNQQSQKLQF